MTNGEDSLRKAVTLNAADYDGWASLGGVIKREADNLDKTGQPEQALAEYKRAYDTYRQATDVSEGNSYPLLNEIKLAARIGGKIPNDIRIKLRLPKAERFLKAQVADQPPSNAPWSFFDLSEVKLYSGDAEAFMNVLGDGLTYCTDYWQPETHLNSLLLLKAGAVSLPGLDDGLELLREATAELRKSAEARKQAGRDEDLWHVEEIAEQALLEPLRQLGLIRDVAHETVWRGTLRFATLGLLRVRTLLALYLMIQTITARDKPQRQIPDCCRELCVCTRHLRLPEKTPRSGM
jgi:hypothetical protein